MPTTIRNHSTRRLLILGGAGAVLCATLLAGGCARGKSESAPASASPAVAATPVPVATPKIAAPATKPTPVAVPVPAPSLDAATAAALDAAVESGISGGIFPGAVLIVGRDGKILVEKAYGNSRTVPEPVPMKIDQIFDMASVSKVMGTATASMLLIEDGKLDVNTPVSKLIPEFAANGKEDVKVIDLLTHRSGLAPYDSAKESEKVRGGDSTDTAMIRRISSLSKRYPTGEYTLYSCLNFLTEARVNETVAKESQQSLLKRRVWGPLGMEDTGYKLNEAQRYRVAPVSKTWNEDTFGIHDPLANYYTTSEEHCPGNAGLYSSAPDVAKYCMMILNEGELNGVRVFKPESIRAMTAEHARLKEWEGKDKPAGDELVRGIGWQISQNYPWTHPKAGKNSVINHTGYTGTFLWIDKNSKSFIVLLSNSVYSKDPPETSTIRKKVTGIYLDSVYGKPQ